MPPSALGRRLLGAGLLSAVVLVARIVPAPSLIDGVSGQPVASARLVAAPMHLLLTPFASVADLLPCNDLRQDVVFVLALLTLGFGWFRFFVRADALESWFEARSSLRSYAIYLCLALAFLAWAVLWPRSGQRVVLSDPDVVSVDFHSHSSASWDGRSGFSPEENVSWHARLGFDASFLTDHNVTAASAAQYAAGRTSWAAGRRPQMTPLPGEEVSLDGAHVILLGPGERADPAQFQGRAGLQRFLGQCHARFGGLALMSLPEYWQRHWRELDTLADWGADGFELAAYSPRGMLFPEASRRRLIDFCRRRNLFLAAATDNHGYAQSACAWNLLRLPGWRALPPDQRLHAILGRLSSAGFSAVTVAARPRTAPPASGWRLWLDPLAALWLKARGWTWAETAAAATWIWLLPLAWTAAERRLAAP